MDIRFTTTTTQLYKNVPDFLMSGDDLKKYNTRLTSWQMEDVMTDDKPIGYWFIQSNLHEIHYLYYKDKDGSWIRLKSDAYDQSSKPETHKLMYDRYYLRSRYRSADIA